MKCYESAMATGHEALAAYENAKGLDSATRIHVMGEIRKVMGMLSVSEAIFQGLHGPFPGDDVMQESNEQRNRACGAQIGTAQMSSGLGCVTDGCAQAPERVVHAEVKINAIEDFEAVCRHVIRDMGKATRLGWNGRGMHIEAQWPDKHSKMAKPYMFITNANGERTPWVPSQGDLFARDWALLPQNYVYNPF
jgi:hypothetical protein